MNAFRVLKNGTGFIKTWLDVGDDFRIRHASIPLHLVYKPIRGNGCQRDKTPYTHQLIPMNEEDWKFRKGLKIGGKSVYENLDLLAPGFEPAESLMAEEMRMLQNQITGMDVEGHETKNMRYMIESHATYYPPEKLKAVEIIVWWSLRHGLIHRVVENDPQFEQKIRPLSDYWIYPSDGFAYQRSLPEIIRHIQESANYTLKQKTDARDIAMMPPGFIDKDSGFDPHDHVLAPNTMYEIKKGTQIQWREKNISPIIEAQGELDRLWEKAKIRTGFTDIFMGQEPDRGTTLGGDGTRMNKAETRFKPV